MSAKYLVGMDVGSTTVKAVVIDAATDQIVWSDYQRHETKQPEKVLEFLERLDTEVGITPDNARMFITGSGGAALTKYLGAKFVQEVNAVSLAVEKAYPDVMSVVELGGQDAKIIIFKEDPETGRKKKIPSMNDKCAGGTGAVIDKINAKLRIPADELRNQGYNGFTLHPVAGKCGVFAETDINGLQKQGVPREELMASLFESIIVQNMSVLTRGHTLKPVVALLGGPNTYIRGMVEAWRYNIPIMWAERKVVLPEGKGVDDLIIVPDNAQYFAAIGSVEFGKTEEEEVGRYLGFDKLRWYLEVGRNEEKKKRGGHGLYKSEEELRTFIEKYTIPKFVPKTLTPGTVVQGFVGIDGGSTSTKAVLMDANKELICKAYQLSKGNPIEDTMEMFEKLRGYVEGQGARLEVLGVGTTGYAKDILKDVLAGDVALVETVAHTMSALHYYDDVDVICDVGGQDIKIIILNQGRVTDFKLNTQCSAGNGYFLQSTAGGFGHPVEKYAEIAFTAKSFPKFGYGCAVFMQSDIVDFQRQGWAAEEIMAGLADVLPKNIWLYVSQIPNLPKLGKNFVLQGGTQHNLAAVKTQVDFIQSKFKEKGAEANVFVHRHTGESGAIGACLEAIRLYENGHRTQFIGLDRVRTIEYTSKRDESTRCYFCKNKCLRTFIDVKTAPVIDQAWIQSPGLQAPPPATETKRLIIATCEKGTVEDVNAMREIKKGLDSVKDANPNLVEEMAKEPWKPVEGVEKVSDPVPTDEDILASFLASMGGKLPAQVRALAELARRPLLRKPLMVALEKLPAWQAWKTAQAERVEKMRRRDKLRIGIPRALNMYSHTPFFMGYFQSLGVLASNIVFSDFTTEELYKEGAKRGAIDPCFPSKLGIPHVHNLLYKKHPKTPLDVVFFPQVDSFPSPIFGGVGARACPTVVGTSEAVKAAFTKEGDLFKELGTRYLTTFLNLDEPKYAARQMFEDWAPILGLSEEENRRAIAQAYKALEGFGERFRRKARKIIDQLEAENRIAVVLLGRPYHNDPGINHEILEEFQKLGYPIISQDALPWDKDLLERLFGDDLRQGKIRDYFDIGDVWKNSYSENTNRKVWAAKFVARHPNLIALELSSFKCGHDAPIYTVIEETIAQSGTPYFSFKDIDENKPTGSIKIRVETIGYFLKRYREDLVRDLVKQRKVEEELKKIEAMLRAELAQKNASGSAPAAAAQGRAALPAPSAGSLPASASLK